MFKLVIQDDEGKTTVVPLIRDEITIGRKEGNTIRLTERNVSRRHARILRNNGEVSIEDLGSYNGIRVNNARIAERVALRVSDQVQIGDYKLYLKAEGLETAVDDARTMPIERVDTNAHTTPTEQLAAAVPTEPMPAVAPPKGVDANGNAMGTAPAPTAAPPGAAAKHSHIAVADTDPQGRPIASPAALAAIAAPAGHGKLVVLSSNFAGKEFELSRPQMIVGRTDENDIVINHRSISRNHAKLVRERESGRYTISDLQSSNGVRVNGNDYGKVELRKGDVVDLGHVRMRFVEPGEDFVFARDAVITDVTEGGGRRGLLLAVILGLLVLGGVAAVWLLRGGDDGKKTGTTATGTDVSGGVPVIADAAEAAVAPIDALVGAVTIDGPRATDPLLVDCLKAMTDERWFDVSECAHKLEATDPDKAKELLTQSTAESKAETALRNINEALKDKDLGKARRLLATIGDQSVYFQRAKTAVGKVDTQLTNDLVAQLRALAARRDCVGYEARVRHFDQTYGGDIAGNARDRAPACVAANADTGGGGGTRVEPPKGCTADSCGAGQKCEDGKCVKVAAAACDFEGAKGRGDQALQGAQYALALGQFDVALRCRFDGEVAKKAFLAACLSKNEGRARALWPSLPASGKSLKQRCVGQGMDPTLFP